MPTLIQQPTIIDDRSACGVEAAGNKPKRIEEFVGRVNSQTSAVSVARMVSPAGWVEPGQTPQFDEYTVVLAGMLRVTSKSGSIDVAAGQAVITHAGEWVQYGTPAGAEYASEPPGEQVPLGYIAVCLPAFSMETVHRDP
jgi:mannose-6-phosphate isomerase-like protein (cupin superfamily)